MATPTASSSTESLLKFHIQQSVDEINKINSEENIAELKGCYEKVYKISTKIQNLHLQESQSSKIQECFKGLGLMLGGTICFTACIIGNIIWYSVGIASLGILFLMEQNNTGYDPHEKGCTKESLEIIEKGAKCFSRVFTNHTAIKMEAQMEALKAELNESLKKLPKYKLNRELLSLNYEALTINVENYNKLYGKEIKLSMGQSHYTYYKGLIEGIAKIHLADLNGDLAKVLQSN